MRGYVALLLLLAAIWGASFMFIKIAVDELAPTTTMALRLVFSAFPLLAIVVVKRGLRPATSRDALDHVVPAMVLGVVSTALPFTLIAWGETRIDSGVAAIGNASMPIFVGAARAALPREPSARPARGSSGSCSGCRRRRPGRRQPEGRLGGRRRHARRRRGLDLVRDRDALHAEPARHGAQRRARRVLGHVGRRSAAARSARSRHPSHWPGWERDRGRPRARAPRHRRRPAHLLPADLPLRLRAREPRRLPAAR